MSKRLSVKEQQFLDIRNQLEEFNEELRSADQSDKKFFRIDYEYIYEIQNMEVEDFDPLTGRNIIRPVNDVDMRRILAEYALESFNINLPRTSSFTAMISSLTDQITSLNEEEIQYHETASNNKTSEKHFFTTNDLLFASTIVSGNSGTITSVKPNEDCIQGLTNTINKDDLQIGRGFMRALTDEEINEIIDPDFILGC